MIRGWLFGVLRDTYRYTGMDGLEWNGKLYRQTLTNSPTLAISTPEWTSCHHNINLHSFKITDGMELSERFKHLPMWSEPVVRCQGVELGPRRIPPLLALLVNDNVLFGCCKSKLRVFQNNRVVDAVRHL